MEPKGLIHWICETHCAGVTIRTVVHAAASGEIGGGIPAMALAVEADLARANYSLEIDGYRIIPEITDMIPTPGTLSVEKYIQVANTVEQLTRKILADDENIEPTTFLVEPMDEDGVDLHFEADSIATCAIIGMIADDRPRDDAHKELTKEFQDSWMTSTAWSR